MEPDHSALSKPEPRSRNNSHVREASYPRFAQRVQFAADSTIPPRLDRHDPPAAQTPASGSYIKVMPDEASSMVTQVSLTNVPGNMLRDRFGIAAMVPGLSLYTTPENQSEFSMLLSVDHTRLGLNLDLGRDENLLSESFMSAFDELPRGPLETDFQGVKEFPESYMTATILKKKAPIDLQNYTKDTLFYLYYNWCRDVLQVKVSAELYTRGWRYHKKHRYWLRRANKPDVMSLGSEFGEYFVFDAKDWKEVPERLHIVYDDLDHGRHGAGSAFQQYK